MMILRRFAKLFLTKLMIFFLPHSTLYPKGDSIKRRFERL